MSRISAQVLFRGVARNTTLVVIVVGVLVLALHSHQQRRAGDERADIHRDLPNMVDGEAHTLLSVPGSLPESTFGLVGDVAVAEDGRTFVLDVLHRVVSVFATSGERSSMLGRPGQGPGEFIAPIAIALDDEADGLYVLDERRGGIDLFDIQRGEWLRTLPLDFRAFDLCSVSGRLYVLGARNGYLLHEIHPADGMILRSFAPDVESRNLLQQGYRASGYIGCAPSGEIALLPSLRHELIRFSAESGQLLGTSVIPGYRAVRVRPTADGGMRFDVPGGGAHDTGSSVLPLPRGDWLIQVGRLRGGSNSHHEFESIRSFLLSREGGEIEPLPLRFPRIMAASDAVFYTVETSPHPAVRSIPRSLQEVLP